MFFAHRSRLSLAVLLAATSCFIAPAAHASEANPTPTGPSVQLPQRLIDSAGAYQAFLRRSSAINPAFADMNAVAQGVRDAASWEPKQVEEGQIAFAAIVALQDPLFVQGVRELAADPVMHERLTNDLLANPYAITGVHGADTGAALVASALRDAGEQLMSVGKSVKQAAYDIQHQAWSTKTVLDSPARLVEVKRLSATRLEPSEETTAALVKAALETRRITPIPDEAGPAYTPVVVRGLAVAALALMGETGDADGARLEPLLSEAKTAFCLKMAKLDLFQCLAVAGPHYEHVFCLGEHGLKEASQCVISAGAAPHARPVQLAQAAPPVSVPVAVLTPASVPVASEPAPAPLPLATVPMAVMPAPAPEPAVAPLAASAPVFAPASETAMPVAAAPVTQLSALGANFPVAEGRR